MDRMQLARTVGVSRLSPSEPAFQIRIFGNTGVNDHRHMVGGAHANGGSGTWTLCGSSESPHRRRHSGSWDLSRSAQAILVADSSRPIAVLSRADLLEYLAHT